MAPCLLGAPGVPVALHAGDERAGARRAADGGEEKMNIKLYSAFCGILAVAPLASCKATPTDTDTDDYQEDAEQWKEEALVGQKVQFDLDVPGGNVRVHYGPGSPVHCEAVVLGVGTAMSPSGYDELSYRLVDHGYVVVIMDHNPGNMVKTDAAKYAALAGHVKAHLLEWIPGSSCTSIAHWILGGHSAGGQAAQGAISKNPNLADAIASLDPYDATAAGTVQVPAMYWGFETTTCFVDKNKAAKAAYDRSLGSHRALYRVKKQYSWGSCGWAPTYFHCSFADEDCLGCTDCTATPPSYYDDVATSIHKFIQALFHGSWSKGALSLGSSTPLVLYTDSDKP
ncbi:MAG: hypothetical protein R3B70_01565 [Polyangiaceae bacterium]